MKWTVRSLLTLALPFVLFWVFVAEFWQGVRSAWKYARIEVRLNLASYRELMKRTDYG